MNLFFGDVCTILTPSLVKLEFKNFSKEKSLFGVSSRVLRPIVVIAIPKKSCIIHRQISVLNRYMHNKVVIEHSNGFLCKINNVLYVDFLNKVSYRKQRNNYLFRTMLQLVHLIGMCLTVSGHWQVTHSSLSTFTSWQTRMRKTCTM